MASQHKFFNRADVDQLFGIDHGGIGRQRHGTAGITGAAPTRDDGQAGFDTTTHQLADFLFGIRIKDDEGIFDTPVSRIGDVRDTRQPVKSDVVLARVLAEDFLDLAAQIVGFLEMLRESVNGYLGRFDQALDLGRAFRILALGRGATLFDFDQAMTQRIDQRITPVTIGQQIVFQIRIALHDPDVAQHLVKHSGGAPGDAFDAEFVENRPVIGAKQPDDDLAIGKRGVVCRGFRAGGQSWEQPVVRQKVNF